MNLKERIKEECNKKGINVLDMLDNANINRSNYYHQFIAMWKPRVAAELKVDEEEFFKGFESEIQVGKTYTGRRDYAILKTSIINIMKERWLTIEEIKALTGFTLKQVGALLSGIKYSHNVEVEALEGQKRIKRYRVVEKFTKTKMEMEVIPISKLPKKISKFDLLTWSIQNTDRKFDTSHDLVIFAKRNNKQVYERNQDGEVYFL